VLLNCRSAGCFELYSEGDGASIPYCAAGVVRDYRVCYNRPRAVLRRATSHLLLQRHRYEATFHTHHATSALTADDDDDIVAVASIAPNLESKSGATFFRFWAQVTPPPRTIGLKYYPFGLHSVFMG